MVQTIIVYIIGVAVFAYVSYRIYRLISGGANPCADCEGCELRTMVGKGKELRRKQRNCADKKPPAKPSCGCGCSD